MIQQSRRNFLRSLLAAPAIVSVGNIMPVRTIEWVVPIPSIKYIIYPPLRGFYNHYETFPVQFEQIFNSPEYQKAIHFFDAETGAS